MDRIECYVKGERIGSGTRVEMGDIESDGDLFEKPSDMFRALYNMVYMRARYRSEYGFVTRTF